MVSLVGEGGVDSGAIRTGTYCLLLVRGASSARAAGAAGASVTAHFDGWVWGGGLIVVWFGAVVEINLSVVVGRKRD